MTTQLEQAARLALEALESCDAAHPSDGGRQWYDDKLVEPAITALRAALADGDNVTPTEPVQKPVPAAWRYKDTARICDNSDGRMTAPPGWVPLYTAPPQRKPLTDEEMRECAQAMDAEPLAEGWPELIKFARAIERAHGITP